MYLIKEIKDTTVKYVGGCMSCVLFNCICKDIQNDTICNTQFRMTFGMSDWEEDFFKGKDTLLDCNINPNILYNDDSIQLGPESFGIVISLNLRMFSNINDTNKDFEDLYDIDSFLEALSKYFDSSKAVQSSNNEKINDVSTTSNKPKSKKDVLNSLNMTSRSYIGLD